MVDVTFVLVHPILMPFNLTFAMYLLSPQLNRDSPGMAVWCHLSITKALWRIVCYSIAWMFEQIHNNENDQILLLIC